MNTTDDYAAAVAGLLPLAQMDTSGGVAARRILLSAYNGERYSMSPDDFMKLDQSHRELAYRVLAGRVETLHEPHELVDDGESIFRDLEAS